ncbi:MULTISPECIES: site-specific integrase [Aeromonas]|uniref:site-specific integrase n=1 Tax=Aeromonas TaxID=642 RepID=UPI0020B1D263|nr:tyrosine-type recombinase/integrase [Aeromonas hydrophila]MCP3287813.1 tyrosine-type recombinase/integrase [Aeromonas hydrophila]
MATFRKRGPYQWEAQVRRKGYPAQSKTFNTKAEAEAWSKVIESEMTRGIWVSRAEAEATSLYEALCRYETEVVPHKKGAVQELSLIRIYKALPLASRALASIRGADVAKLRDEWLKDYQPATVLRRLALLSHVFNMARKEWGMESLSNPLELIRKPQADNARTRRIAASATPAHCPQSQDEESARRASEGEIERIIAASGSRVLPSLVILALETAMRRSELVSLRWEHIDLERRVAHLPSTKNGSARDVPLSTRAVVTLQSVGVAATGRVFDIRADAVTRAFERAVKRARQAYELECQAQRLTPDTHFLINLRFHDLRHEGTSRLAEIFPMHELTKITGHRDPRMLMRYYHPKAENLAKKLP